MIASFPTAARSGLSIGRIGVTACSWAAQALLVSSGLTSAGSVSAGIVFREVELVEERDAAPIWQQRQVFVQDDQLKILVERSTDPLQPAGSYFLTSPAGSFFVDPSHATLSPVIPADMQPTDEARQAMPSGGPVTDVVLEREVLEPGPLLLDLPTRHGVCRLRYREAAVGAEPAVTIEERHEFWAAVLADADLAAWRARRIDEDGGSGEGRAEVRAGLARLYGEAFFVRHIIDRRASGASTAPARVVRAVTGLSHEDLAQDTFRTPAGLADSEFLVPAAGGLPGAPGDAAARDVAGEDQGRTPARRVTPQGE